MQPKIRLKSLVQGFTLLEVLIALAVFAIIATITAGAMRHTFEIQARLNKQVEQLSELQLALTLILHDTQQITSRAVRGNDLRLFPPFIGQRGYVEFTRGGLINPLFMEQRSSLQRIAFLCQDGQLIRRSWDVLDTTNRKLFQDKVLLSHLSKCSFAYVAHNHQVLAEWQAYAVQQNQHVATIPIAIRMSLTPGSWGNMSLLYILPPGLYGE